MRFHFEGRLAGESFLGPYGAFPLGDQMKFRDERTGYAIRYDRVAIRPAEAPVADEEVKLEATFV
ncbi:ABC transporter ATP-binding protein, partial [Rhizobium johnstonii]